MVLAADTVGELAVNHADSDRAALVWPPGCHPLDQAHLWCPVTLYQWQRDFINAFARPHSRAVSSTNNESGKPQPKDLIIPTPQGMRRFGDLKVGDQVFSRSGKPCTILAVYDKGERDIYQMDLDGGEVSTLATGDHLWWYLHGCRHKPCGRAHSTYNKWDVVTTDGIIASQGARATAQRRGYIPNCEPVEMPPRDFLIHPYVIGCLIGDGMLCRKDSNVMISSADAELLCRIVELLPPSWTLIHSSKYDYRFKMAEGERRKKSPIICEMKRLGLAGKYSHEKEIPHEYLFSSREQRIDLLRGLMDTDGCIGKRCNVEFSSTSKVLSDQVAWLVRSLGGKARIQSRTTRFDYKTERKNGRVSYRVWVKLPSTNPFYLKRKADRWYPILRRPERIVYDITPAGRAECMCILVDSDDHSYLTNDFIVTHNTSVLAPVCLLSSMAAFPGSMSFATSGSERQVKEQLFDQQLVPIVEKLQGRGWKISKGDLKITAPNSSTLLCYVCKDAEKVEGFHGYWAFDRFNRPYYRPCIYWADESKSIKDDVHQAIRRIDPDYMGATSTPGKMSGWFHEAIDPDALGEILHARIAKLARS